MEYRGTAYVEQPAKLATATNARITFINALASLLSSWFLDACGFSAAAPTLALTAATLKT
jgi:hypothetical protein